MQRLFYWRNNMKGIDIWWNKNGDHPTITDWQKVKNAGIDFIIPRDGTWTGTDSHFLEYVKAAQGVGIKVPGVFHFIYALTVEEARQNAAAAVKNVQAAGLPKSTIIWCDLEGDTITQAAKSGVTLTNQMIRQFTETFCDYCLEQGYCTGVYLNQDYLVNRYGKDIMQKYDIWFADPKSQFSYDCLYKQNDWWAKIDGISGNVDTDIWVGTYTAGTAKPKETEEATQTEEPATSKVDSFIAALEELGDGRYYYYGEGNPGIGCSDYVRLALLKAGIIKAGETFWAGQSQRGILTDTSRFQYIDWDPRNLRKGDILWSQGHHVAVWDGGSGVYEGSPVHSHGLCDNGKTGVGRRKNHTYWNCGNGTNTWSNIYRIIDVEAVKQDAQSTIIPDNTKGAEMDKTFNAETLAKYMPVIRSGKTGDMVKALQIIMRKYGWYNADIDGSCGPLTVAGIKHLQTALGVDVDGSFGPQSWTALLSK